jgi:O-antigen ligase
MGGIFLLLLLGYLLRLGLQQRDWFILGSALLMIALMITETYLWRQRGLIHFMILYLALTAAVNTKSEQRNLSQNK